MNDEERNKSDEDFIANLAKQATEGPDKDKFLKGLIKDFYAIKCKDYSDVNFYTEVILQDPRDRMLISESAKRVGVSVECPVSQNIPLPSETTGKKNGIG